MAARQVRALLMGGQACVFYGAAEFSRDTDLLILADERNLECLKTALDDLQAQRIAVPAFSIEFLERGHAVHFRCGHPEAAGMRVDIMSKLRGVDDPFSVLWERRTTLSDADGTVYELLALTDLVKTKKTQRSKDWPMLQRLVEAHYLKHRSSREPEQQLFWLRELRTPEFLTEAVRKWPELASRLSHERPLLGLAQTGNLETMSEALLAEERAERELDRLYWQPLKTELEQLRHNEIKRD
jgi:hypothetical protein